MARRTTSSTSSASRPRTGRSAGRAASLPRCPTSAIRIFPPDAPLPGITSLDGPGSEGLTRRQTYTVTEIRGHRRTELFSGKTLVAVPSNVGSATMPNYEDLAAQGIYAGKCADGTDGVRVFAGQRAETFYIDLGAVFDTLNLRRYLPLLTAGRGRRQVQQPIRHQPLRQHQRAHHCDRGADQVRHERRQALGVDRQCSLIGVYASTSRYKHRTRDRSWDDDDDGLGAPQLLGRRRRGTDAPRQLAR